MASLLERALCLIGSPRIAKISRMICKRSSLHLFRCALPKMAIWKRLAPLNRSTPYSSQSSHFPKSRIPHPSRTEAATRICVFASLPEGIAASSCKASCTRSRCSDVFAYPRLCRAYATRIATASGPPLQAETLLKGLMARPPTVAAKATHHCNSLAGEVTSRSICSSNAQQPGGSRRSRRSSGTSSSRGGDGSCGGCSGRNGSSRTTRESCTSKSITVPTAAMSIVALEDAPVAKDVF